MKATTDGVREELFKGCEHAGAAQLDEARGEDVVPRPHAGRAYVLLDVGAVDKGGVDGAGEVRGGHDQCVLIPGGAGRGDI